MKKQTLEQEPQISSCATKTLWEESQDVLKVQIYQVETQCNKVWRAASLCENTQKAKRETGNKAREKLDNIFMES